MDSITIGIESRKDDIPLSVEMISTDNSELHPGHDLFLSRSFSDFSNKCFEMWFGNENPAYDINHYYPGGYISRQTAERIKNEVFISGFCKGAFPGSLYLAKKAGSGEILAIIQTYQIANDVADVSILSAQRGIAQDIYPHAIKDALTCFESLRFLVFPENNPAIKLHNLMMKRVVPSGYGWGKVENFKPEPRELYGDLKLTAFQIYKSIES